MRNEQHELSKLKHKIYRAKAMGHKYELIVPNITQLEYLKKYFPVEPYLYKIKIWFNPNFNPNKPGVPGIIKSLYFEKRNNHKSVLIRPLKKSDLKACDRFGIKYRPYKYKILLQKSN